jgi:hypothetical protein
MDGQYIGVNDPPYKNLREVQLAIQARKFTDFYTDFRYNYCLWWYESKGFGLMG